MVSSHQSRVKRECHPRESGDPEILASTLDSRLRGNDELFLLDHSEVI